MYIYIACIFQVDKTNLELRPVVSQGWWVYWWVGVWMDGWDYN